MQLSRGKERVLIIPDLQAPFHHKDTLAFLSSVNDAVEPTRIVCIGDSMDMHAMSQWGTDPDGEGPGREYKQGLKFMRSLYKLFPEAVEVQSNHNRRVARKAFAAGIPKAFIRDQPEWMEYPEGWSLHDNVVIDDVVYEHGDRQGGMYAARNLAIVNGRSTVIGHHHSYAGVSYVANEERMYFGMNVGCLLDMDAYAFAYAKQYRYKPTMGCGIVVEGVPSFVPMFLNKKQRWTGSVVV